MQTHPKFEALMLHLRQLLLDLLLLRLQRVLELPDRVQSDHVGRARRARRLTEVKEEREARLSEAGTLDLLSQHITDVK